MSERGARLNLSLSAALASMGVAACTLGPRYTAPVAPPSASGSFVSTTAAGAVAQPLPDDWWRLYDDPVLNRLVQRALVENQDLKVAAANLENAQALFGEARAGLLPTTTLSAGASYGRSSTSDLVDSLKGLPARSALTYDPGFTVSYELDLFGRVRRTLEATHADADAIAAAEDAVRTSVAAQTAQAYVNICAYAEQAAVARRSLEIVRQTHDITVRERDAGSVSDFEVARAATLLRQAEATVPVFEGERRVALFELTALLGETPARAPADAAACRATPVLATPLPVGDGAALLRRRPDLRQAERQLAASTARIGVATAALYPDISLGGSVSSAASRLSGLSNPLAIAYGIGPTLSWAFPNNALARSQIAAARAVASGSLANFNSVLLRALKEAEQSLSTETAELDHHAALAAARDQADEALRLANVQSQAGALSFVDLLQTETIAVNAAQALAASDQQLATDQVAVFKALGGGWRSAPPVMAPQVAP